VFDTGNLWFVKQLVKEDLSRPALIQLCLGIPYGVPADTGPPARNGQLAARRRGLDFVRHQPDADALGLRSPSSSAATFVVGARGINLISAGCLCEQCANSCKSSHDYRSDGCAGLSPPRFARS